MHVHDLASYQAREGIGVITLELLDCRVHRLIHFPF